MSQTKQLSTDTNSYLQFFTVFYSYLQLFSFFISARVGNRTKPYKTVENRSNSGLFRTVCMVNFYGFLRFRTVSYSFVQFPIFAILTGKICYVHKKFSNRNKMYESI